MIFFKHRRSAERDAFSVPSSVQKSIPIKLIYQDGVFQVSGKFSKTWRFFDVNYAVASPEKQRELFMTYCSFLNSLPIGATAKITLFNRQLNQKDFGRTLLMPMQGDRRDLYRNEYIELVVALPFVGHDAKWDQRSKRRMEFILQHCSKKEVIGNEDCRESYVKRNCYMVDQANYLVAVYDDVRNLRSGTMQCVRYARKNDVPVVLIHPDTANITYPMESIKSAGCDLTNNNISWKKR